MLANGITLSSSVKCWNAMLQAQLSIEEGTKVSTLQRFHSERAAHFKRHASNTKYPDTREMYLRLAEVEMALAAKEAEPVEES
jgi:hypothetical protein